MKLKTILLIDDDEDDQLIFTDAITELGDDVECIVAKNGYEAFEQLKKAEIQPSVIFLDLNMPVMNGFEFLELLRCMQPPKEIPVVVITTSNDPMDIKRSAELGIKDFFTKTSDFTTLKLKLGELIERNVA
jgi:CheY-like chemotaxis protein